MRGTCTCHKRIQGGKIFQVQNSLVKDDVGYVVSIELGPQKQ